MAPASRAKQRTASKSTLAKWLKYGKERLTFGNIYALTNQVLFDPEKMWIIASLLWLAEAVLNVLVIRKIPYTEIDWIAYMEEVGGFVNGTMDYMELKGSTGPLVYPAGFVYVFTGLFYITDSGKNIRLAQYLFAVLYLATLLLVFYIYNLTKKVPPYVLFFMCCASYRIHSIYILRLFNDPVAMFFLYLSICCFLRNCWNIGSLFFSIAVSIKMNVLLFSPGLLIIFLLKFGIAGTIPKLGICAIVQLALAFPFLMANPFGYIARSFDFGRKFFFKWTVNWRFLPEWFFLHTYFHVALLVLHIVFLVIFFTFKWPRPKTGWMSLLLKPFNKSTVFSLDIVLTLFSANFIGVCFARSLHYQFYVWYFHTLPFLLWSTGLPTPVKVLLLGILEICWNTYPSTVTSSLSLHTCHIVLLFSLLFLCKDQSKDKLG